MSKQYKLNRPCPKCKEVGTIDQWFENSERAPMDRLATMEKVDYIKRQCKTCKFVRVEIPCDREVT